MDVEEQRRLLINQNNPPENSSEEEWSDESSDDSYYSDSDSSVPEWESSIHDTTGELLFIDCHPFVTQNIDTTKPKTPLQPFSKDQLRRSTRGKFLRLIRRRESQRHSRRYPKTPDLDSTTNKVKFHDSQEGEEKEVVLKLSRKPELGLPESLLGISVGTLSDGNRVMVAGFPPDSEAKHEKNIKIGDWLKSVNNIPVTNQNLNSVLDKLSDKHEVLLKLQRVAGVEVTKDPPINELNCQSRFVRELVGFGKEDEQLLLEKLAQYPIGILYLNTDKLSEGNPEYDDVIYSYPLPFQKSVLCQSRGIFITLNHLINDVTRTKPQSTSFFHRDKLCHLTYTQENNKLLLFLFPDSCASVKESVLISNEIKRMFLFMYQSLDQCFTIESNRQQINHFFARCFTRLLNAKKWTTSDYITGNKALAEPSQCQFEDVLPVAPTLPLPNEAYMQVDDALTELEASDYREWNEEPLDCQRLFTILGSALYHHGYLLISHLMYEDLIDVHVFCRQQGFFHLSKTEPVKTLLLWKEVFPHSCNRSANTNAKIPDGKRYLLLVGSRKDLLAVIMEAGGCTEPAEDNMGPDAFYVEEAQATLAHIQELGIPELADRWISTNPGPQVTIPETCTKRKSDFLDTLSKSVSQHKEGRKPEVTSILKRRNSDQNVTNSSSFFLDDHSDSGSQCESRRSRCDSDDSDDYGDGSQMSNSSFDISELRQTILSETGEIQPRQLTAGKDNVLFHFIQFDATEGILIGPPECRLQSQTIDAILDCFRNACHKFHSLFQNTLRFKNMPAQDMAKSVMNKSLIAIKEHGVMFECPFLDDIDNKKSNIKYWVVGRLFYMPHPREVYVCYQENIPQNIIELAFKIDLDLAK
ncbi:protein inturned [Tribolium castaneum]|uniref:Protein inturned n=1 Tax=Tribolium castaneum TaxID=7070 RepID=D6WAP3_TRICA|nr:PREDICTED: protein inturned [Tribolium castaneum]EEZ98662.1 Protein inturned-like Protein [Tribolium castaneum]|eukprot:XP_975075.1 PREDICTED: protein inturned [Tribolium castaneum]